MKRSGVILPLLDLYKISEPLLLLLPTVSLAHCGKVDGFLESSRCWIIMVRVQELSKPQNLKGYICILDKSFTSQIVCAFFRQKSQKSAQVQKVHKRRDMLIKSTQD
jgi:hypothetical protein